MKEIIKIGYERIDFYALYHTMTLVFNNWYNYSVSYLEREKETIKEEIKNFLSYYYIKDDLFNEPLNRLYMIYSIDAKQASSKIVTIPQKELEIILLKNKLVNNKHRIMQEKEFDKTFDELYPKLIERLKQIESYI